MAYILTLVLGTSQVFATGSNRFGKLGLHEDDEVFSLVSLFSPINDFKDQTINRVHIGKNHAFATNSESKLYGWGDNSKGQLGLSKDDLFATYPKLIPYFADKKIKYCDGGLTHSVAIDYDNNIYTFGDNSEGQLGRLSGDETPQKIDMPKLEKNEVFTEVHTNMDTNYALTSNGNLYVWGSCEEAGCPGHAEEILTVPTKIELDFKVSNFFVGIYSIFLVADNGKVYGFGANQNGQLCIESDETHVATPTLIPTISKPRNIQASLEHSLFLIDGQVYACGSARDGQFGEGFEAKEYSMPQLISGRLPNAKSIAATGAGTYILSDGALYASGKDWTGELSYGQNNIQSSSFKRVATYQDLSEITKVVAHFDYAFMYAEHEESSNGLPTWAIVLIVIGCVCVVGGIVGIIVWYLMSKKKQPRYNFISEEKNKLVFNDDQW